MSETIVFTNGCFDLLHVGHVRLLQWAAEHGDRLVVGVNSDASVVRLKGVNRPIVPENERRELVAALRCVSYAEVFDDDTPLGLIRSIQPSVLVKGPEWHGREAEIVGANWVWSWGGKVVAPSWPIDVSTTRIIERILLWDTK